MSLINLLDVQFSVGGPLLLDRVSLSIESGERICVVGRNGAGKSTLLKLLAGELRPDDGEIRAQGGVRVARLSQEVPAGVDGTVFDVVAQALGHIGELIAQFHRLSHALDASADLTALAEVQHRIEAEHGWALEQRVEQVLKRLDL